MYPEANRPSGPFGGAMASSTAAVLLVTASAMITPRMDRLARLATAQRPAAARPITGHDHAADFASPPMTESVGLTEFAKCPGFGFFVGLSALLWTIDVSGLD